MDPKTAFAARLQGVRTIPALRRKKLGDSALTALVGLGPEALAFAAQNPQHSEAGRNAARTALAAEFGSAEAERRIASCIDTLPPPNWLKAADVAKGDGVFFGLGAWVRRAINLLALATVIVWIGAASILDLADEAGFKRAIAAGLVSEAAYHEAKRVPTWDETMAKPPAPYPYVKLMKLRSRPGMRPLFRSYYQINSIEGQGLLWSLVVFPLYTIALGLRRKPARVLLLRRFNDRDVDIAIARFVRRALKPYGHSFTLADKYFHRSWLAMLFSWFSLNPFLLIWRIIHIPIGFVIRLFDRSRAGPILVWSANDFRHFANRLSDRYGLNIEMSRTRRSVITVRTSDVWWQSVVLLLMHAADVIVVDVTEVAAGTTWELEAMLHEHVEERIVFVARVDEGAEAHASLAAHGFANAPLFTYEHDGRPTDPAGFRAEMLAAMRRKLAEAA